MATFKAVVASDYRRQDGTYSVKIRVTHKRKTRYISTPFYVSSDQITRGFKIKDNLINEKLDEKIIELRKRADQIGFLVEGMDIEQLVYIIQHQSDSIDFIAYVDNLCVILEKEHRYQTAKAYKVAVNSLRKYNKNKPLYFSDITKQYMLGYWGYIRNLSANTQNSYITCIKSAYRRAQREFNNDDTGVIIVRHGVFNLIELPPSESANENAFEKVEDMQSVIDVPYTGSWLFDFTKDMFILSFTCFGINLADLFIMKKDNYQDGILTYRRKKVARRLRAGAEMKIKVPAAGRVILEKYSGDSKYLIDFGHHSRRLHIARYIHATFQSAGLEPKGSYLHKTGHYKGKYVFNTARHTMATFARNICHIDKLTVHEMLNHATPQDMKTTDVYLRRDYSHLWDANEKLMALFDWSFYLSQPYINCER